MIYFYILHPSAFQYRRKLKSFFRTVVNHHMNFHPLPPPVAPADGVYLGGKIRDRAEFLSIIRIEELFRSRRQVMILEPAPYLFYEVRRLSCQFSHFIRPVCTKS